MSERLKRESSHSLKIKDQAENIWGWASPAGVRRVIRRSQFFIDLGQISPTHQILEIGCGTGIFTERVAQTGASIVATDLSEDLLDLARKKEMPKCRFDKADAHELGYPNEDFDIVFGSSILHHLEIPKALHEIFRVLKPDGKMIFAEPNMMNPQILIQKNIPFIKRWLGDSPDESAFFRWQIKRQLKNVGFQNIKVFPYDFLHPLTPNLLIRFIERSGKILEKIPLLREIAGSLIIFGEK